MRLYGLNTQTDRQSSQYFHIRIKYLILARKGNSVIAGVKFGNNTEVKVIVT